jgi:beta-lactamase regulating signal transducer with metallopeptidase domain
MGVRVDTVLNWIWQGIVVALGTAVALTVVERARARDRYLVVWAALLAVLALPFADLWALAPSDAAAGLADPLGAPLIAVPTAWWTTPAMLGVLWTVWAAIALVRLARSFVWVHRVRQAATPMSEGRQAGLSHWNALRTQGRLTRVVVSSGIRSAAVVGCGAPVVAVAPALLDDLADDELDRIVIHEWAHVQRRDDLIQLLQACIRVVVGWHPAVWWLDRQLGIEREIACDELVVATTGSAKAYASSLVKLASLPTLPSLLHPELTAIAATGLRRRVERIISADRCRSPRVWQMAAAGGGLGLCLLAAVLAEMRAFERPRATAFAADVHLSAAEDIQRSPAESRHVRSAVSARPVSAPKRTTAGRLRPPAPVETTPVVSASSPATAGADATAVAHAAPIGATPVAVALEARLAPSLSPVAGPAASPRPWQAAADGGVTVGRQSREAAAAAAGYFTRLGKRIAGSF